jgi:hypothetical protein|tara:strand:+ start:8495 stop:8809 length:315 start_codon:yes stop_codon:yes gene_type:complete
MKQINSTYVKSVIRKIQEYMLIKMSRMICRDIICKAEQYQPKKKVRGAASQGYRRCSVCEIFLKYDGIYCPCCSNRMRVTPNNNKARQRVREKRLMKGINNTVT